MPRDFARKSRHGIRSRSNPLIAATIFVSSAAAGAIGVEARKLNVALWRVLFYLIGTISTRKVADAATAGCHRRLPTSLPTQLLGPQSCVPGNSGHRSTDEGESSQCHTQANGEGARCIH